jgi:hypothetical protein
MPDEQNPYDEDEEEEFNSQFSGNPQFASGANPSLQSGEMQMPRKAIPRKPSSSQVDQPQNLDYGVYPDAEEEGYKKYAKAPPRTSLRTRQSSAPSHGGGGDNPLKVMLFQIASIMPGMGIRVEERKKSVDQDKGFKAPPGPGSDFSGPRPPSTPNSQAPGTINRKSALDDLAGRDFGGRSRDAGTLEQSPVEKFIEKIFGGANADAPVQEVEAPEVKQKKLLIRIGIITVLVILVLVGYNIVPRQTQLFDTFPREFRSAENEKSFKVLDPATAVFAIGTDSVNTPVKFFMNDLRDYADVLFTVPFQKQIWLVKTDRGVKDIDSNFEMYEQRSKEYVVSAEAQKIAERVTAYFARNHSYPTGSEDLGKYFNPYTEKQQPVQVKQITEGNTKSGEDIDQKKLDLYKELIFSKSKLEGKETAGNIGCWNVKFVSAHQNLNIFIIKPYGTNGESILGGHPDAQFFIALEDGQPKELLAVKPLFEWTGKSGIRPLTTVLFANQLNPMLLLLLKHSAKVIFTILAFGSLGFLLSLKKGESPIFWIVMLVITGVPAILAIFGNFIP